MKKLIVSACIIATCLFTSVALACGIELVEQEAYSHIAVKPGTSISFLVSHGQGKIPLATILHTGGTTLVYSIQRVSAVSVLVQVYNYGIFPQSGTVTVGFWE